MKIEENKIDMNKKIIQFALECLKSNISDPEIEAMVAVSLGLTSCEEDYEGDKFEIICDLINQAARNFETNKP